jgi:mono/diheme cytochrome c family protein
MMKHLLAPILLIAVLAVSCKHQPIIPDSPPATCDTLMVSYSTQVDSILTIRCGSNSCHGSDTADGGFGLMEFDQVTGAVNTGGLIGSIFHQTGWSPMPDGQPMLDSCKINTILAWVNQGAQDN